MKAVADPFAVIAKLPRNSVVIIRDYDHPQRKHYANEIIRFAHKFHIKALLAGDVGMAQVLHADGVHLPEYRTKELVKIRREHPRWILSAALHTVKTSPHSGRGFADFLLFSAVFASESHPERNPIGIRALATVMRNSSPAVIALGGICPKNIRFLKITNPYGMAAIRGFLDVL